MLIQTICLLVCYRGVVLGATHPEKVFLIVCLLLCLYAFVVVVFFTEGQALASKNSLVALPLLFVEETLFGPLLQR